jgi:hypothetical protein
VYTILCFDRALTDGDEHPALELDTAIIDEAGCVLEMVCCTLMITTATTVTAYNDTAAYSAVRAARYRASQATKMLVQIVTASGCCCTQHQKLNVQLDTVTTIANALIFCIFVHTPRYLCCCTVVLLCTTRLCL